MFIKTDNGIVNLVPAQLLHIYVSKPFDACREAFWSVSAQTQSEGGDFVLCQCDTKEEAEQALDKLWVALINNEIAYDMT